MIIKKMLTVLIGIFIITTLLIPMAPINKIVFISVMIIFFINNPKISRYPVAPLIILLIFVYGFALACLGNNDLGLARQFLFSILILFLIYPIVSLDINIESLIKFGGGCLLVVDFLFILYGADKVSMTLPFNLNNVYTHVQKIIPESFFQLLEMYGETAIGRRGFFGSFDIMIHMGTIPFLYLPVCLWFIDYLKTKNKWKLVLVALSLFVIFCSSSRALLLIVLGMCVCLYVLMCKNPKKRALLIMMGAIVLCAALAYILQNTSVFSSGETSNSIKIGHIISAVTSMGPVQFVFGSGLGGYYYSTGVNKIIAHTEITLIDYCRYIGVPLALFLYLELLCPSLQKVGSIVKLNVLNSPIWFIFVGYLAMSLTNPVLINSMGVLVIVWYWTRMCMPEENVYE